MQFNLHEIPDPAVRGREEYWAVYFAVHSIADCTKKITAAGGQFVADMPLRGQRGALMHDPDGGAFVVVETTGQGTATATAWPWKAWAGLALTLVLIFTNMLWPWAIFFAAWVVEALRSRETYLFERVGRGDHPALYWILIGLYAALAVLCLPIWGPLQ